jgi:glyoxylase-like metal-dependent hydrolase (beta-lactamase superfamily II)
LTSPEALIRYPFDEPPSHGEAVEVADGVLWLRLPLPVALDHVNVYAFDEGDSWTILDTGFDTRKSRAIWEATLAGPLRGKPVERIIVTHYHPDHIGLAGWFVGRGAALATTRTSWILARMLTLDVQTVPPEETLAFYRRSGMDPALYEQRRSERPFNFADCVHSLPVGYDRIVEGQEIRIGGRRWITRIGHGHAPEHATFWSLEDNLVIGGDQLLPSISPNLGVYANEPEADPVAEWLASCERLKDFATEEHLVFGGHKLPFLGLPTRLRQLADNHIGALGRLLDHLKEPKRGGECFVPLFKREIGGGEYGMALGEAIAHLNHLHQTGRARRWIGEDGAYRWQAVLSGRSC